MIKRILYATNSQKVLDFLLWHPDDEFFDRQISRLTGVSRAGTNFALRDLAKAGLIKRERRGKMYFYKLNVQDSLIFYLKIVQNIVLLHPLIKRLEGVSLRIILYGSAARGENTLDSDSDLFILSKTPKKVRDIVYKSPLGEKLQWVINTPNEYARQKKKNPAFYKEISRGITLWGGV